MCLQQIPEPGEEEHTLGQRHNITTKMWNDDSMYIIVACWDEAVRCIAITHTYFNRLVHSICLLSEKHGHVGTTTINFDSSLDKYTITYGIEAYHVVSVSSANIRVFSMPVWFCFGSFILHATLWPCCAVMIVTVLNFIMSSVSGTGFSIDYFVGFLTR